MNIGHVYVDESLRGNGVGNVLVEKAVKYIKDKGYVVQATCPFARKYLQENECE
jgi:predicted GNAT family acetyltransferase